MNRNLLASTPVHYSVVQYLKGILPKKGGSAVQYHRRIEPLHFGLGIQQLVHTIVLYCCSTSKRNNPNYTKDDGYDFRARKCNGNAGPQTREVSEIFQNARTTTRYVRNIFAEQYRN